MQVTVRLFAALRERAGSDHVLLDLPEGATVGDALAALHDVAGDVQCVLAVNRDYAAETTVLHAGDEVALIPPVSGGAGAVVDVAVVDGPLSLDALVAAVRDPGAGAIVTFSGVTREVAHLDYEAYAEMAEVELRRIAEAAVARHDLLAAVCHHRYGRVALGEPSVLVAVSSGHRPEAFAGAREIIDEVKARVPIWKAEDGEWKLEAVPDVRG